MSSPQEPVATPEWLAGPARPPDPARQLEPAEPAHSQTDEQAPAEFRVQHSSLRASTSRLWIVRALLFLALISLVTNLPGTPFGQANPPAKPGRQTSDLYDPEFLRWAADDAMAHGSGQITSLEVDDYAARFAVTDPKTNKATSHAYYRDGGVTRIDSFDRLLPALDMASVDLGALKPASLSITRCPDSVVRTRVEATWFGGQVLTARCTDRSEAFTWVNGQQVRPVADLDSPENLDLALQQLALVATGPVIRVGIRFDLESLNLGNRLTRAGQVLHGYTSMDFGSAADPGVFNFDLESIIGRSSEQIEQNYREFDASVVQAPVIFAVRADSQQRQEIIAPALTVLVQWDNTLDQLVIVCRAKGEDFYSLDGSFLEHRV